jgi:hypothetical protein
MTNTTKHTILVIGSTGKTGTRVVGQFEMRGIAVWHGSLRRHPVRLGQPADLAGRADRRRHGVHHLLPGSGPAGPGRDIAFVPVSMNDYTAMLTKYGLPKDFAAYAREAAATGVWTPSV